VGIIAELNHHHIHVMMAFGPVIADEDHQSSPPSSVQLSLNLFRARGHPAATSDVGELSSGQGEAAAQPSLWPPPHGPDELP
jgi:hypothetical protein